MEINELEKTIRMTKELEDDIERLEKASVFSKTKDMSRIIFVSTKGERISIHLNEKVIENVVSFIKENALKEYSVLINRLRELNIPVVDRFEKEKLEKELKEASEKLRGAVYAGSQADREHYEYVIDNLKEKLENIGVKKC